MVEIKCPTCQGKRFNALKTYVHKVEVDEKGTVIENHGVSGETEETMLILNCLNCREEIEEEF